MRLPPRWTGPSIYAELRAEEVWRFDGAAVAIEQLQPDGTYAEVPTSRFLPVSGEDICRWLLDDDATVESVWKSLPEAVGGGVAAPGLIRDGGRALTPHRPSRRR